MFKKLLIACSAVLMIFTVSACSYTEVDGVVKDKDKHLTVTYTKVGDVSIPNYSTTYNLRVNYNDENGENVSKTWSVRASVYDSCDVDNAIHRDTEGNITCSLR